MQQDANDALSTLDHAFAAAMEHQRALMESATAFVRGESLGFFKLRLDRARGAMEQLGDCRDMSSLLTAQKEWVGDLVQDYAAQSQRVSELWQQGADRLRAEMERQAGAAQQAAHAMMDDAAATDEAAAEAAHEAVHGGAQDAAANFAEVPDALAPDHQGANERNDQLH
jgi:hypothetical protein